eukprot:g3441.t1
MAAVLLDTGGDLDKTWSVFQNDFQVSQSRVTQQISDWRQRLRETQKTEVIESGALLPKRADSSRSAGLPEQPIAKAEKPIFGLLEKGAARRNLLEYCKREKLKMKFEGSEESNVFKETVIVDSKKFPEAEAGSKSAAQDDSDHQTADVPIKRMLLHHCTKVDQKAPEAPATGRVDELEPAGPPERPKGVARKELTRYCNQRLLKFRFSEREVSQADNRAMFYMRVVMNDRSFPEGAGITKPAAQDMAAELALLELRGTSDGKT